MKKLLALALALVLAVTALCIPASADEFYNELVKVVMSSELVTVSAIRESERATTADLDECLDEADPSIIPPECSAKSGRLSIMAQMHVSCSDTFYDVYDITYKVWSTLRRTVLLFYRNEETMEWQLLSCNLGDVIEARFSGEGTCVIAVAW